MYLIAALLMLFRGGADALLMRLQLAAPNSQFLPAEHYNEIFTTHGTIMILFMAMPFMFALFNIAVPLQIGARAVLQFAVLLFFFMHIRDGEGPRYNVMALILGVVFAVTVVAGAMWIMSFNSQVL